MLGDNDAIATVAVKDVAAAREFYETKLGLRPGDTKEKSVLTFKTGNSKLLVYQSQYAGTNQATSVTWVVKDVDGLARELASRGVRFEHYDMPGMERRGDVYVRDNWRGAWFKDPEGNIHHIVSG
jgi:catechol 2,3-dioxygenase-like lactoylglutathione lyase family enzyme